jgi:hypothetical protein
VRKVWKLRDACDDLDDFGDMTLVVERLKSKVARGVARAAEDLLCKPGAELVAALA